MIGVCPSRNWVPNVELGHHVWQTAEDTACTGCMRGVGCERVFWGGFATLVIVLVD